MVTLVLLCGVVLVGTSSPKEQESPGALMQAGLEALYAKGDFEAAAAFRKVPAQDRTHYGATYQLAVALDRAGKPAEARPLWEKIPQMAEGFNDKPAAETTHARLAVKS